MPKKKNTVPKEWGNNFYKSGWQPGLEINEQTGLGEITHVGTDPNYRQKFDDILLQWGFDPQYYEIEGTVRASSWNAQLKGGDTTTFYAFKGIVKKKNPGQDKYFKALFKQASRKPPLKLKTHGGDTAFMWFMADWQLGKKDYGVENTIKRYDIALQDAVNRIKELRKVGVEIDEIYMVGLGDLTENCSPIGFYDSMAFSVSLSLIEQYALARSMIMKTIETFLPHADKLVLAGVPGNHGEMTRSSKGQVSTSRLDNSDTMHLDICGEIMAANKDRYKKVKVDVAEGFHQVLNIKGIKTGFSHGHMSSGSGNPENKIENWWKGQMYGWLPAGDAEILVTAHYHHLRMKQQGDRTWFQCPSIDASKDFTARTGMWNDPGVLTFTIDKNGWSNYKIV